MKSLLEFFNITGCVNIEFIKTDDYYYLMDFNLRVSAGIKFSYAAGADFLGALLTKSLNYENDFFNDIQSVTLS